MAPGLRFSIEPHRAPLTPSASPSVAPPDRPPTKRPRLRSTPSSCVSATPSTSNDSTSSADVDSARRASTLRVLNVWAQLAERYNKRLDEDDIVDLYSGTIIKDRGVCRSASREYHFGHIAHPDGDPEGDQDQEDSEQDDDDDELNGLPPSEATDDDVPISKKELLRGVPPLSSTTDAEDLREFLDAEKRRKELAEEEEDEDLPLERLFAMRKALAEQSQEEEAQALGETSANHSSEPQVDDTPRRPSARAPPSEDESEDELAIWVHDESTAVYRVQDVHKHKEDPEVIDLSDSSESDREFEALLTRPARFVRAPPRPIPHTEEVKQPLQSPPDSERGRSRTRPQLKVKPKVEITSKSDSRPRSPLVLRRPEVILTRKVKSSVSKEAYIEASDDDESDQEVMRQVSLAHKGKGKEVQSPIEDNHQEDTPKSLGGRKRKRMASSTGGPLSSSPDQKKSPRSPRGKSTSQTSITLPQPDAPESTLDQDVLATPSRPGRTIQLRSRSFSMSKAQQPTLRASAYRSPEPEPIQPAFHNYISNRALPPDPTIAITHPYPQRHPSSILSSPNQATPGPSHAGPLPPPLDPVQTQQAHYLLAQAMQQLSYLLSAMPPYPAYAPNPGQPWHPSESHPHPPPPHATYSTPIHYPPHIHGTRAYHTPSSSISHSGLPPSSPFPSSISPAERSGGSRSRGRRVSFKDADEVAGSREHSIQPEPQHGGPRKRMQIVEGKREGKEKATDVFDDAFREDRGSSPGEIARGRTPGPPNRKKRDVSRGRSLSRR